MGCLKAFTDHLQTLRRQLPCAVGCPGRNTREDRHRRQASRPGGIPLSRKLCYAVGGVPYQITNAATGLSLQIFLLDVVQIEAFYVSLILFVSRVWDGVTDPLVGYLVSRSSWTPIGKLMPWVVLSMPFTVLSYVLLWVVPGGSVSQAFAVPWFLTATCLFETLMSCLNVPYLSLNMFLGGDQRDRDSATAYRMGVEMAAMLVASVIQGQVLAVFSAEREGSCGQLVQSAELSVQTGPSPAPHAAALQATRKAFLTSALVMGALVFLCCLVLYLGVREQQAPLCAQTVCVSYCSSLKMLVGHVPYQRLVMGFLFAALAFQMSLGNFALFCSHAAGHGDQLQHLLLVLLTAATVVVPLWQALLVRVGKKTTVLTGLSLFIPAVVVIASVPNNLPVFMAMCILMGFSVAAMFLLPWSMLPDVVDDFAVQNPCCKGLEPLFFSCYAFCNKLGGGLSAGISTMTLHFVGYEAGACNHGDGVVTALVVLFAPVPIALLTVGLVCFHLYPIDEERRLLIQSQLLGRLESQTDGDAQSEDRTQSRPRSSLKSQSTTKSRSDKSDTKPHHKHHKAPSELNNQSLTYVPSSETSPKDVRQNVHHHSHRSHPDYPTSTLRQDRHCNDPRSDHTLSDQLQMKSKVTWV